MISIKKVVFRNFVFLSVFVSFNALGGILDFVENRDEIEQELDVLNSVISDDLLAKMDGIYDSDLFKKQTFIYNGMLKLYLDGCIDDKLLLDAWVHVELMDQFGAMDKCSLPEVLGSTGVDRVDLTVNHELRKKYLMNIEGKRGGVFATKLRESMGKSSVYFSRVFLTSQEKRQLLLTRGSEIGPQYERIFHLRQWIMRRADMNPEFCSFLEDDGIILLSSYFFFHEVLKSEHSHYIRPVPVLGKTKADHLFEFRCRGKHPVILFHPSVLNNFLTPHDRYSGVLACTLHDWFHIDILRFIPEAHRAIYLHFDMMERELDKHLSLFLCDQGKSFPEAFNKGLREIRPDVFSNGMWNPLFQLHLSQHLLSDSMSQERLRSWLDQQFRYEYGFESDNEAMTRVWLTQMKPLDSSGEDNLVDFIRMQFSIFWLAQYHPAELMTLLRAIENSQECIHEHKLFYDYRRIVTVLTGDKIRSKLALTIQSIKFWQQQSSCSSDAGLEFTAEPFKILGHSPHYTPLVPVQAP
ncbi:hypothetical protein [Spongorhabdus nitratireducens]